MGRAQLWNLEPPTLPRPAAARTRAHPARSARQPPAAPASFRCAMPLRLPKSLLAPPSPRPPAAPYSDSESSSEGRSVAASSVFSHSSSRSPQRDSFHNSKRLP